MFLAVFYCQSCVYFYTEFSSPSALLKDLVFKIVSLLNNSLNTEMFPWFPGKVLSESPSFRKPGREGGEVAGLGGQSRPDDWTSD